MIGVFGFTIILLLNIHLSDGCFCENLRHKHFQQQFCDSDFVMKVKVLSRQEKPPFPLPPIPGSNGPPLDFGFPDDAVNRGLVVKYKIEVEDPENDVYKHPDDVPIPQFIWSYGPSSCGLECSVGETYLILGEIVNGKYITATKCEYNALWKQLSKFQKKAISNRTYNSKCSDCTAVYCLACGIESGPDCCKSLVGNNKDYCKVEYGRYSPKSEERYCLSRESYCERSGNGQCMFTQQKCFKKKSKPNSKRKSKS